jgi:glycosyltransferase involved in cell wall biosynthesis
MKPGTDLSPSAPALMVMMPVYNDWPVAFTLLERVDATLSDAGLSADVLLVDDGSSQTHASELPAMEYRAIGAVSVLRLRRNLGHQRAIAIGIAYIFAHSDCDALCIMDADGEDDPADLPRLVEALSAGGGEHIVFAERSRRSESAVFRLGYRAFRALHVALTGYRVRFGNFSIVPRRRLENLACISELWNHYVAAVITSRIPYDAIPTRRARRIGGRSKMDFPSLVIHGLRALSVFADRIGLRLLILTLTVAGAIGGGLALVIALRLFTDLAIPGWASQVAGLLLVLLAQSLLFILLFVFLMLSTRSGIAFVPSRDYEHFVAGLERLRGASSDADG